MGRHSASGSGSPNDRDDSDDWDADAEPEYVSSSGSEFDTGSLQRSHRSGGSNWGVSKGLVGVVAAVLVVAVSIGLWWYFDRRTTDNQAEASATCVHGDNAIAVVADPSIADRIGELSERFNKKHEVIGDYCFTVSVRPADTTNVIKGLTGQWPAELGAQPALWIPGSSISSARLKAAAKTNIVSDSRSLVSTPVVIATTPRLRQAIPADKSWADLPALQNVPNSLDGFGLPGWGSLRLALPSSGNADATQLAAEAVAAASVRPGDSPELGAGAAASLAATAPKLPANNLSDALGALLDGGEQPGAAVHSVVTTEQQLYARTRSNGDAKKVIAAWLPAGATPIADYPTVQLDGAWLSEEQHTAASQFARFLGDKDQLKDLAAAGFRAEGADLPSSDVVSFAKIEKPLSIEDKVRVALADGTSTGAGATTIMLDSSLSSEGVKLSDVTGALANRIRTVAPGSGVGLWTYDGKEGNTVVRLGAAADDVEGAPRSQSVADALTALQPTSNGAVAFTTLRNVYQEAVNSFRPNQVNSVLIVAGHSHTDQSLDGAGLIDTINRQKDPARPVRINVIDFGNDSDQQTWQTLAQQTGGAYQNLAASNSPELAAAITRFVS
ncbi:vWA domain-containing protein [Mycobacteroides salmoniphilum]|uniref:substrate-binding domain-containing protein n=1 Tax=Mycobacteroides salmoniphilum TaxID=404941 RepID=UPI0009927CDD|nr:substrate-binding domain-containing protein [Mycobacteroides salmoniphilum]